jgi:hypothetical protein
MMVIAAFPSSPAILRRVATFFFESLGVRHRLDRVAVAKLDLFLGMFGHALLYGFTTGG